MAVAPNFIDQDNAIGYNTLSDAVSIIRAAGGVASPNRYEVVLHPPVIGMGGTQSTDPLFPLINTETSNTETADMGLKCESIVLPGRNLNTTDDATIYGPLRTVVDGAAFDDAIEMTFNASPDMRERIFFEKWQHAAFDQTTWNVNFYWDYVGSVDIYILEKETKQEKRMYGLKLFECFPKTITASPLSYATQNEAIKITVSMNFRYWKNLDLNMGGAEVPIELPNSMGLGY